MVGLTIIVVGILLACLQLAEAASIVGTVVHPGDLRPNAVHVALFRLNPETEAGLTKQRLLGVDRPPPLQSPPSDSLAVATRQGEASWKFAFHDVRPGNYTLVAFEPAGEEHGHWLDFAPPRRQLLGFYYSESERSPLQPYSDSVRATTVAVEETQEVNGIDIVLSAPHLMPDDRSIPHGSLRAVPNFPVRILHVRGDAFQRGYAHGLLLAQQILDFFEFFLLEDMVRSTRFYLKELIPALRTRAKLSEQFKRGAEGMLSGMRASRHSMMTSLGRDFELVDIVALNTYSDALAWTATDSVIFPPPRSSCSQFVFWGDAVARELTDGTIAGRNMDGENDVRKLTVNGLIIHAVEPTEDGLQRYAHVMWPGFISTSSGFDERGRYLMENAGCNPPGPPAKQSPLLRDVISSLLMNASIGNTSHPNEIQSAILDHQSELGGSCMNGCILVSAEPFVADSVAGFIYEGDRFGGALRTPGMAPPNVEEGIMATNHFMHYKALQAQPGMCNGVPVEFSSLARYFAGQNKIEAWARRAKLSIGVEDMKELLQTVAHGTTEHSIIFKPNEKVFLLAVASPNGVWDASYEHWQTFNFDDLFTQKDSWHEFFA
eukprot:TRINITY_DN30105_c0_g1_i1.p1 TRINITY_DN30105_c0_g1~~TRINITY_DN30105_c0_g1_i1.p1  ORF type:complete len:603 (-),score=73.85 TRINITY_DN30105_c0_g1_i1:157-1965(-)